MLTLHARTIVLKRPDSLASMIIRNNEPKDRKNKIMTGYQSEYLIENIDCVTINGIQLTPSGAVHRIQEARKNHFDLQLVASPIVRESERVRRSESLTDAQREQLDYAPYELTNGVAGEKRFRNEFDYYAALIRATEDNADQVFKLKRDTMRVSNLIHQRFSKAYDEALINYGRKEMGSNDAERKAWFRLKYPALNDIMIAYDDFLDEIDVELERWQDFSKAASRMLSATEMSYRSTGRMLDRRSGKYDG